MAGLWRRFKLWVRRQALRLVWRIVSSRLYRALHSLVSASLLPLATITTGALIGLGIAASTGFVIGYGALIGAGSGLIAFLILKFGNKVVDMSVLRGRTTFQRKEQTSHFARSSWSRRRAR